KVMIDGPAPKRRVIDMSSDTVCAKDYSPTDMPKTEGTITGANGALANVVVYISAGANDESTVPSEVVTLDQRGCRYVAHVTPIHVNQQIKISNSDATTHNVHALGNDNQEWNRSQASGASPFMAKFERAEFVPVKCNFHPWMHGYIAVLKTNHFAVSDNAGA